MKASPSPSADPQMSAWLRAARETPALPPRFEQNVWRRIRDSQTSSPFTGWLDQFAAWLVKPRFAFTASAALLLVGFFLGATEGIHAARQEARTNYLAVVAPHSLR